MKIVKDTVVSLKYQMFDQASGEPLVEAPENEAWIYLHGGYDDIFPTVEEALHEKQVGDKIDLQLSVEEAYGEYEQEWVRVEDIDVFPEDADLTLGMTFETDGEDGELLYFRVIDIADGKVTLDGNHPLAGVALRFVAEVTDVREATPQERQQGFVDLPDA